jgi:hypothetical protein
MPHVARLQDQLRCFVLSNLKQRFRIASVREGETFRPHQLGAVGRVNKSPIGPDFRRVEIAPLQAFPNTFEIVGA